MEIRNANLEEFVITKYSYPITDLCCGEKVLKKNIKRCIHDGAVEIGFRGEYLE